MEIQSSKLNSSLEESKKNHDYLLTNYKSAEKLSYFQKRVSQLSEEKALILQTNSETIKNLTNEINELNIQLNECKKKELEYLKVNTTNTKNYSNNFTTNPSEAFEKNTSIIHKNSCPDGSTKAKNKAELFFENENNQNSKQEEKPQDSKKNVLESDDGLE